jgi:alpha-galactosidase
VLVIDDAGDGNSSDHGVWAEPTLVDTRGAIHKLTDRTWLRAAGGWGQVSTSKAPGGGPMMIGGKPVAFGIAAHAQSVVEYKLPADVTKFRARISLDDGALKQRDGGTVRFLVYTAPPGGNLDKAGLPVAVKLADLGLPQNVAVRDLWARKDLGVERGEFAPLVNWHGTRLLKLEPR